MYTMETRKGLTEYPYTLHIEEVCSFFVYISRFPDDQQLWFSNISGFSRDQKLWFLNISRFLSDQKVVIF